ncbi:RNA-binding protein, putative [Plasmodium vinckei]|uniref:RNA-binding protein, putative n=3 Tax=Plasmodium vinckei TaxID=5860 RepID=A0A6V7T7L9_PLAVN|nr:RNA-binding protein, putative [Plasmodium vinckei petteri]CAD2109232.1 RNA-binding protein, putative [Plasmodium vinckei]
MSYTDEKRKSEEHDHKNDGSTLYVSNLSSKITTEKLQDIFEKYGTIEKCYVISNPITKESRNFGFVTFNSSADAEDAMNKANKMDIEGRVINVEIAKRNEPHEPTPGEYKGVQNTMKRYPMRHDYHGRRYDPHFDRRKYDSRRPNPYNRDYGKGYGYRNGSFRHYDKYARNSYDHRHYDRRSIDNKYHKKGDYYKRRSKSSDGEKRYSRDDSRRRKRYDRARKSTSVSGSERRRYRNSSMDRSSFQRRK